MRKKELKKFIVKSIGDAAISLGTKAVGKCMIPGLFDPKLPESLREEKK
ncbi:MAG: hypothetical protein Q4C91_04970 [Eubacteriales bacterium]|nr:hypothetical protein [Eubacteriales bacterium]